MASKKPETLTVAGPDIETVRQTVARANPPEMWDVTVEPHPEEWAQQGARVRGLQAFRVTRVRRS